MGTLILAARTRNIATDKGTVHAMTFLCQSRMAGFDESDVSPWAECRENRRVMGTVAASWERKGLNPKGVLVYNSHNDKGKPEDGDEVFVFPHDCPYAYEDAEFKRVGFLRSRKVGRKTVWTIVPNKWEAVSNQVSRVFFTAREAVAHARKTDRFGYVREYRTEVKSATERLLVEEETANHVCTVLLSGPWPAHMWEGTQSCVVDQLVASGRINYFRDTSGVLNCVLAGWQNLREAAVAHFGAPGSAVTVTYEDGTIRVHVDGIGSFEGRNCSETLRKMQLCKKQWELPNFSSATA